MRAKAASGQFAMVRFDSGTTVWLADSLGWPHAVHLAFLVDEASFDLVRSPLDERGLATWADPSTRWPEWTSSATRAGRGLYWDDPHGNTLEIVTVPNGGWRDGHPQHAAPMTSL